MRQSRYFLTRFLFVTITLLFSQYAFCWGTLGHRVIGEIAQQHLSKKAKKELRALIGKETLAWWANWPDFIRSDTSWNFATHWHYVDLPAHQSKDNFITALKQLPGKNLYTQIQEMQAQLKDKSLSLEKRRTALFFLVHFLGDLHQPLHVGRDEDQGGNKIVVYWFGEKTNLHTLWDSKFVDFQQYSYSEYARLLDIADDSQVNSWVSSPLEDWFYESHVLSDSIYDNTPAESKLNYRYNYDFQNLLNQQLLKGGVRLASILNEAFK